MRIRLFPGPELTSLRPRGRASAWLLQAAAMAAVGCGTVTLLGFAQTATPVRVPHPILLPEANRPPDANEQMQMREQKSRKQNFDKANAERLRQMEEASQMMETIAIALKAEVDNEQSGGPSQGAVHKAETIEKLAHIVKERMKLTVASN